MTSIAVLADKTYRTEHDVVRVLGFPVSNVTRSEAVARVRGFLEVPSLHHVIAANTNKFWLACHIPGMSEILAQAEMIIPEYGAVWAARMLGTPLSANVRGIGLFVALLPRLEEWGVPVYLLGAQEEILQMMLGSIRHSWPRLRIAGARNGFFSPAEEGQVVDDINRSGAGILFVGMGSPRQEFFIEKNRARLRPRVAMGVGGSFDALSGIKKEPPAWTHSGFEWLYRLCQDPKHLWRRYMRAHPWFIWQTLRERITGSAPLAPASPRYSD